MFDRLLRLYITVACFMLMMPIVVVIVVSFSGDDYLTFPPGSLSWRWFALFFGDPSWQRALLVSLGAGIASAVLATAVGFVTAYAFLRSEVRSKKMLLSLVLSPIIVPHIITAIAMYYMAISINAVGSFVLLALCHSVMSLPVVVLILLSSLQSVDPSVEKAAIGMGCSRLQLFLRVVMPIAWPGVVSAGLFAFLTSFDELLIALFLGGSEFRTLPVRIWQSLEMELEPTIAAVSAFLIAVTAIILLLDLVLRSRRASPARTAGH